MFEAPLTDGVSLFIWIVCFLAAFGAALTAIDVKSTFKGKEDSTDEK